jgi:hypothetical protein
MSALSAVPDLLRSECKVHLDGNGTAGLARHQARTRSIGSLLDHHPNDRRRRNGHCPRQIAIALCSTGIAYRENASDLHARRLSIGLGTIARCLISSGISRVRSFFGISHSQIGSADDIGTSICHCRDRGSCVVNITDRHIDDVARLVLTLAIPPIHPLDVHGTGLNILVCNAKLLERGYDLLNSFQIGRTRPPGSLVPGADACLELRFIRAGIGLTRGAHREQRFFRTDTARIVACLSTSSETQQCYGGKRKLEHESQLSSLSALDRLQGAQDKMKGS